MDSAYAEVEFSRPFPVDKLRDKAIVEHIEANEEECAALADRLDLVAIKELKAELSLNKVHSGDMAEVSGRFFARVVQTCVVSLEPFETEVGESFRTYFIRHDSVPKSTDVEIEDDRSPEPINPDGTIDLGELTAQNLSLALDPHPRKPGAVFAPPKGDEETASPPSPFAVLADFRAKKGEKTKKK